MIKRCCEPGCEARIDFAHPRPPDWYLLNLGFALWACPAHAETWRDLDFARAIWKRTQEAELAAIISAFEKRYNAEHPYPSRTFQQS